MRLTPAEKETIIRKSRADKYATFYTSDPADMRKFDSSPLYRLVNECTNDGKVVSREYVAEKRFVTIRLTAKRKTANH